MLRTVAFGLMILLSIVDSPNVLNDVDNAYVLGDVVVYAFADDYFCVALEAGEDFTVTAYLYTVGDAFLAVSMSAGRNQAGSVIVCVVGVLAKRAGGEVQTRLGFSHFLCY